MECGSHDCGATPQPESLLPSSTSSFLILLTRRAPPDYSLSGAPGSSPRDLLSSQLSLVLTPPSPSSTSDRGPHLHIQLIVDSSLCSLAHILSLPDAGGLFRPMGLEHRALRSSLRSASLRGSIDRQTPFPKAPSFQALHLGRSDFELMDRSTHSLAGLSS